MTFPSVVSDLFMFAPSLSRVPFAPVESARSEPAKSTKLIFDTYKMSVGHHETVFQWWDIFGVFVEDMSPTFSPERLVCLS